MSYALEIEGLEKVYANGLQALKGIDLRVAQGDFLRCWGRTVQVNPRPSA